MTDFTIKGSEGTSTIMVGETLINFPNCVTSGQTIIITDENVNKYYGHVFQGFPVIVIGTGEKIKTLRTVNEIYNQLLRLKTDRSTFVVGIGGGIVCDIAGFAASSFLRGIRFGFVPTTLLAQVDASVGGKNGVNFKGFKNIIGTFNQPEFVLCDPEVLKTLPSSEISNGFAEIVKHTLIADAEMFSYLENHAGNAINLENLFITQLISHSIGIKSGIVNRDEKENGERRLLNFGHTFGHALEKVTGLSHGQAVSVGMVIAATISKDLGYIGSNDVEKIKILLHQFKLPVELSTSKDKLLGAILKDKKRIDDKMAFVLLNRIGEAFVKEIPVKDLKEMLFNIDIK